MAISINFTKTVDNAVDLSQKKTYINGAFTSAEDIANFPTAGIAVGSELVNVGGGNDTGKKYVFSGTAWNQAPSGGDNRFIVTLTPTAQDYSGTMDKTVAEIKTAYEAGQEIWFKMALPGTGYLMNMAYLGNGDPESTYPSFNVNLIETNSNLMLVVWTGYTNDGTNATYSTKPYVLTEIS